jgi:hypothetical protein
MSLFQSTLSLSQNKIKVWTLCFVVNCVVMFLTSPLQLITTTIASDLKCWTNNSFKIWRAFLVLQYLPNTGFDRRCQHRNQFNLNTQFSSFYRILPLTIIFSPFSTFPSFYSFFSIRLLLLADKTSSWHWFFTLKTTLVKDPNLSYYHFHLS